MNTTTIYQITREDLKAEILEIIKNYQTEKENEVLFTPEQVMEKLNVSNVTLWRWQKAEYLLPIYIGGKKRYKKTDIDKLIDEGVRA